MNNILIKIKNAWNTFFFEPTSPATLGLFRIVFGLVTFLSILGKYPFRNVFYGEGGIVSSATTDRYFGHNPFVYFRFVPDGDPALNIYFLVFLLFIVFLMFGFLSRISSVVVFIGLVSLSNRNFFVDNAGDDLMRNLSFFLMFAPCGAAYSIDRLIRVKRGLAGKEFTPIKPWVLRMIQLQVAYLYFDTFMLKFPGEGWKDGTALYYAFGYLEHRRFDFRQIFQYLWQIKLLTYSVMVAEFMLPFFVWFRRLRYPLLLAGFSLHFFINLAMQFPVFQYMMMVGLSAFIYPEDIEKVVNKIKSKF